MKTDNADVCLSLNAGTLNAKISGEIDHHTAKSIREAIDTSLTKNEPDKLSMDFSGVTFMDSSGLGLLLGRYTKAAEAGIAFSVTGTTPAVQRMFDMAGLDRIVSFENQKSGKDTQTNEKS